MYFIAYMQVCLYFNRILLYLFPLYALQAKKICYICIEVELIFIITSE